MAITYLFILYCFEAGIFFIVIPWTRFWSLNPLLHFNPVLSTMADNAFVRWFITAFGIVHLIVGCHDLLVALAKRDRGTA